MSNFLEKKLKYTHQFSEALHSLISHTALFPSSDETSLQSWSCCVNLCFCPHIIYMDQSSVLPIENCLSFQLLKKKKLSKHGLDLFLIMNLNPLIIKHIGDFCPWSSSFNSSMKKLHVCITCFNPLLPGFWPNELLLGF